MQTAPATVLKAKALRASGTLNPKPERVTAPLFHGSSFFDARDLVQVKYEMLRWVARDHVPVQVAAATFGFSRVAWYHVHARYQRCGLVGLLPQPRGPKRHPQKQSRRWPRIEPMNSRNTMSCSEHMPSLLTDLVGAGAGSRYSAVGWAPGSRLG